MLLNLRPDALKFTRDDLSRGYTNDLLAVNVAEGTDLSDVPFEVLNNEYV